MELQGTWQNAKREERELETCDACYWNNGTGVCPVGILSYRDSLSRVTVMSHLRISDFADTAAQAFHERFVINHGTHCERARETVFYQRNPIYVQRGRWAHPPMLLNMHVGLIGRLDHLHRTTATPLTVIQRSGLRQAQIAMCTFETEVACSITQTTRNRCPYVCVPFLLPVFHMRLLPHPQLYTSQCEQTLSYQIHSW